MKKKKNQNSQETWLVVLALWPSACVTSDKSLYSTSL
jgi:hypothetical protein